MKKRYSSALVVIALLFSMDLFASDKSIRLAAPYITSLIEEDQSGVYQKIMAEALSHTDIPIKQFFFPYKRALTVFEESHVDCIYSFTKVLQEKLGKDKVIFSFPLGAFGYYIFTRKEYPAFTSVNQLTGLKVGAVIGHDSYYRGALNSDTKLLMVSSDEQNIKMLEHLRIDALIGALPDLTSYVHLLSYSPDHPLIKSYDRITCHNNQANRVFIEQLSSTLKTLKVDGTYRRLSGKLYVDFDESSF